jgi:hypothetical protein
MGESSRASGVGLKTFSHKIGGVKRNFGGVEVLNIL